MQPHCRPEKTQWSAASAECILFPQINADSTAVGYYSACIEKCLTIVRYPYTSLIDDRVRQNTVKNLYVPYKWPVYQPAEQLAASQERLNTSI
jgi:hypothetical protein